MLVIDRFEGGYAVIVSGSRNFTVPREQLPQEAAEGDVLIKKDDSFIINKRLTDRKRRQTGDKLRKLIKGDWQ